jgi:non-ribosomal peptide synthetase component F
MQNTPRRKLELAGLSLSPQDVDNHTSKFDLTLAVRDSKDNPQLDGYLEYNTDLFDAPTIGRMFGHFETLVEDILLDPNQHLSTLALTRQAEPLQPGTASPGLRTHAPSPCIHQWFESQAAQQADATALILNDDRLTYGQLNRKANRLAHKLRDLGVGPDVLVGVFLERSLDMVVALLAVLKAGGAYVPMDPTYPVERVGFMLSDANPRVLISQNELRDRIPVHKGTTVLLDSDPGDDAERFENPDVETSPDNLAYVIYTSGSTGTPKGTLITHRNVVSLFQTTERLFAFDRSDVWSLFHSFAFDFSVWEMWGGS